MPTVATVLLLSGFSPGGFTAAQSSSRSKAFWRSIADHKNEPPAGMTAAELAPELAGHLASTDPELRDDLAESILTAWIYQKKLLGPAELRRLLTTLSKNLHAGLGERGTDTVFLRSFSALTLSVIAARDNEDPFLEPGEFRGLLEAALAYFRGEQDLRGFDARKGWIHTAAHGSDLLKFLARSRHVLPRDQTEILGVLRAKLHSVPDVFTHGEDERMARVAISLARRADLDRASLKEWLDQMQADAKFPANVDPSTLRAEQNARHFLSSLWTELSMDQRPSANADYTKQALRETLKPLF